MRIGDLATLIGRDTNTVRDWVNRFDEFFSPSAQKISTSQRVFTEDDAIVIATIAYLRNDNLSMEDIESRLRDGFRVEHPGVANYGVDLRMVPAAAVEQIVDASEIKSELARVQGELARVLEMLEAERADHRADVEKLQSRIEDLQQEVKQLNRELGRAEGRLEERDRDDK